MQARPEALGLEVTLASAEQVDQALHEMAWLTLQQRTTEAASKASIQAEMAETGRHRRAAGHDSGSLEPS